jgi:hypothetical protein
MNPKAAIAVSLFLFKKGGLQTVADIKTLAPAYVALSTGKSTLPELLTPPVIDAVVRLLSILVPAYQDGSQAENITSLLQGI